MTALPLSSIRTDGGTQPRAIVDMVIAEEYANAMGDGAAFPPPVVFYDGTDHWLADGFHRRAAAVLLGLVEIDCDIRQGTRRDAVLFSVGANAEHGMRRTNEDKRRAVQTLLSDAEWAGWSDREIAERCHVTHPFVGKLRPPPVVSGNGFQMPRERTVERNGTVYQQNTTRIGSNPAPRPKADSDRPVFDSTPSGERDAPPAAPPVVPMRPVVTRDSSGDHIHHALTEIARQMKDLPSAREAAARYPIDFSHVLPVGTVEWIAKWFAEFAPAWKADAERRAAWADRLKHGKETARVVNQ